MTEPLALLLYEKMLPGTQLVNRLEDLKYRVVSLNTPALLSETAVREKPLLVLADIGPRPQAVKEAIGQLRGNPATQHLPVVVFGPDSTFQDETQVCPGATLFVSETAILNHLEQLLDQALQVD